MNEIILFLPSNRTHNVPKKIVLQNCISTFAPPITGPDLVQFVFFLPEPTGVKIITSRPSNKEKIETFHSTLEGKGHTMTMLLRD